jgi:peptidoglycan/LPS O-acetylase OafA/YrhL
MKERYNNLDGLRAYAAIGIAMMHVLENGNYAVSGFWSTRLIPSFTNFTFLFMIISAFSMCCGYYDRLKNGTIDLEAFYKRRYQKIWPYFAALCTLAHLLVESAWKFICLIW